MEIHSVGSSDSFVNEMDIGVPQAEEKVEFSAIRSPGVGNLAAELAEDNLGSRGGMRAHSRGTVQEDPQLKGKVGQPPPELRVASKKIEGAALRAGVTHSEESEGKEAQELQEFWHSNGGESLEGASLGGASFGGASLKRPKSQKFSMDGGKLNRPSGEIKEKEDVRVKEKGNKSKGLSGMFGGKSVKIEEDGQGDVRVKEKGKLKKKEKEEKVGVQGELTDQQILEKGAMIKDLVVELSGSKFSDNPDLKNTLKNLSIDIKGQRMSDPPNIDESKFLIEEFNKIMADPKNMTSIANKICSKANGKSVNKVGKKGFYVNELQGGTGKVLALGFKSAGKANHLLVFKPVAYQPGGKKFNKTDVAKQMKPIDKKRELETRKFYYGGNVLGGESDDSPKRIEVNNAIRSVENNSVRSHYTEVKELGEGSIMEYCEHVSSFEEEKYYYEGTTDPDPAKIGQALDEASAEVQEAIIESYVDDLIMGSLDPNAGNIFITSKSGDQITGIAAFDKGICMATSGKAPDPLPDEYLEIGFPFEVPDLNPFYSEVTFMDQDSDQVSESKADDYGIWKPGKAKKEMKPEVKEKMEARLRAKGIDTEEGIENKLKDLESKYQKHGIQLTPYQKNAFRARCLSLKTGIENSMESKKLFTQTMHQIQANLPEEGYERDLSYDEIKKHVDIFI